MTVRYSDPEQSPATHYNPDPIARHADIAVNGSQAQRVLFPHSFHANNFWELTVPVTLRPGHNTIGFSSQELPNFDGTTYSSGLYEEPLRSQFAPINDKIAITPFSDTTVPVVRVTTPKPNAHVSGTVTVSGTATDDRTGIDTVRVRLSGGKKKSRSTVTVDVPVVDGKWTARLDTARVDPGSYDITAAGADRAGNQSDPGHGLHVVVTRHPKG
jgi:Big-like domain-containing protein